MTESELVLSQEFILVPSPGKNSLIFKCPEIGPEIGNSLSGNFMIGINYLDRSFYVGLKPEECDYCGGLHRSPEIFADEVSAKNFYEIFSDKETPLEGGMKYILIETNDIIIGEVLP